MSSEQQPSPTPDIAVAFLVESSLSVAQAWRPKISEYYQHLLNRLAEANPRPKICIAFVTYGFADTAPSPILCKRFFTDVKVIFKELEDPSRLGLGMTTDGGSRGMAALEGFVATIELFDILYGSLPAPTEEVKVKPPLSHIVHIANSSPDTSVRPMWNDSMVLDNVSWNSLPAELKKRNIQLNSINLRPNLTRYSDLYTSVVTGGSVPWFPVRSPHTLYLAPFPSPATKVSPTKRTNDTERQAESKRPRLQPSTESPKPSPKTAPSQTQTAVAGPSTSQPIRASPAINQAASAGAHAATFRNQEVMTRVKLAADYLKELETRMAAAKSEGQTQLYESLLQEYSIKKPQHEKITQVLNQQFLAARQAIMVQSNLSQNQGAALSQRDLVPPPFGLNGGAGSLSGGNLPPSHLVVTSDTSDAPQSQHSRSLSETTLLSGIIPSTTSASAAGNLSLHAQKSADQQRLRPSSMGNAQSSKGNSPLNVSARTDPPRPPLSGPSQSAMSEQSGAAKKNVVVWKGSLVWTGQGTGGVSKEVRANVIAYSSNPSACHADTWPQNLVLTPGGPQVPNQELQDWMRRHQPGICTFRVSPDTPDFKNHEHSYLSFVQILKAKNIYATTGWATSGSGVTAKRALIIAVGPGLAGVFFPLTGLPDLPKAAAPPSLPFNPPLSLMAQMQNFGNLNQQQRDAVLAQMQQLKQAHAAVRQQQQQQRLSQGQQDMQSAPLFPTNTPKHANMNAVMNMMNTSANQNPNPFMATQPSFGSTTRLTANLPGAVPGNVSYEMLQSFVQRNSDLGSNMNPQG
ncbi:hypothetical protein CVT26_005567 [Gymnopilus dilepis]|uniref:Mediator of RNA polymerase II transcription subunit 25 n=1 Tax=Gymnopilus dilepis TaxID=231916 RepID=A0A409XZN3_9AGAR|nr:hypothetical protein CVT26_005567 [Gymnopilus dilepis]